MPLYSDVHFAVLEMLADCGCVSRPMFELLDYNYYYLTRSVKTLLDTDAIRKYGKGQKKHYALNLAGRNRLAAYNPLRFSASVLEFNKQISQHPDRAMLSGDIAALLSCAGYGVHPDDKPVLPAITEILPAQPDHGHFVSLCRNTARRVYPDVDDRRTYIKRLSAIGCFYDARIIKALLPKHAKMDNEGINYARARGVLMTPDYLLRVYHSRDVALKFQKTGERNFRIRILGSEMFQGFRPGNTDAILVCGYGFEAACHIIGLSLDGLGTQLAYYGKKTKVGTDADGERKITVGERLTPSNLGNPSFYLPLDANGMAMASLFQYPAWERMMNREISRQVYGIEQEKSFYEVADRKVFVLASLNMTAIERAFHHIRTQDNPVTVICLNWQEPLFRNILTPIRNCDIVVKLMPGGFVEELAGKLDEYWRWQSS
ncbi:MAG: hypothetical protein LBS19_09945 [Clostridiales bacterium]|jgi:hypothetical protein|nr:hypothetical protein [Clostridiales bacterium]